MYKVLKTWSDENGLRWRLTDGDPFPYISATTVVGIAKNYRYRNFKKDDNSKKNLQKAADIGTKIHKVLEDLDNGALSASDKSRYNKLLTNYDILCKAIENTEGKLEVIELEKEVTNPRYKFSGRIDKIVKVGNDYEVWDYKTSKQVHEEDGWQLSAYMYTLIMYYNIPIKRVRIIHIDKVSMKCTDLSYTYHEEMFKHFLGLLETFKAMYYNDLKKGRIHDIETFSTYKWPLEYLNTNMVEDFITNKGDIMPLPTMTMPVVSKSKKFLQTKDGDAVSGLLVGSPLAYYVHRVNNKEVICAGKDNCEFCKMGNKASFKFVWNFITIDEKDKPSVKVLQKGWKVYQRLLDIMKKENLQTTPIKIERTGEKLETTYTITTTAIKHKAFQDLDALADSVELVNLEEIVNPTFNQEDKVTSTEFNQED